MRHQNDWYDRPASWHGYSWEVAIDLGSRSDQRLLEALAAAWDSDLLQGPLRPPGGGAPRGVDTSLLQSDSPDGTFVTDPIYGRMDLPWGGVVGCWVSAVRDLESDWVRVSVPSGMIELHINMRLPLNPEAKHWLQRLAARLAALSAAVWARVGFDLALVGEDVSGTLSCKADPEAIRREIQTRGGVVVSKSMCDSLHPASPPQPLRDGLVWFALVPTGQTGA